MIRITGRQSQPFTAMIGADLRREAAATTAGVTAATDGMKLEFRQAIHQAGLGSRFGNAIGSEVYPNRKPSLGAAGIVFPRGQGAENILRAFSEGQTIRPRNGGRLLAIPTPNVPRISRGGRGGSRPMTPKEVENHFNTDLELIPTKKKGAPFLMVIKAVKAKGAGKYRRSTARRLKAGRTAEWVPMFVLVPYVRFAKRLDLDAIALRWGNRVPDLIVAASPD